MAMNAPVYHLPPRQGVPTTTSSLEGLQTEEQRLVLDTIARVRKCGLEGTVSLPQIVVCGDQSAGKSSVLEALTEIPFPRNDNLCTRYATEIHLRRAVSESLTIRVIPDQARSSVERASINSFEQTITDFSELPQIMDMATTIMGISKIGSSDEKPRAIARDVLSIEIGGPTRPQLTVVDIPGLIGAETKMTSKTDIALVAEITKAYIEQPRTICLAVVSAATDYANQPILDRVREVDPEGDRTLGVITKPDIPPAGSGSETGYLELAQNQDIFFKLGWHVVKNRMYSERSVSLHERNVLEDTFFRTTNWKVLPKDSVGIESLRRRLSILLFEHVKKELPSLRDELESKLVDAQGGLAQLGTRRMSGAECKAYLAQLSLDYYEICKAAVDGHYEGSYFHNDIDSEFSLTSSSTLCRTRAVIQSLNSKFAENIRINGHKYQIQMSLGSEHDDSENEFSLASVKSNNARNMSKEQAMDWVRKALVRNRGKELVGNFNPLLIGELFWELSEPWNRLAADHVDKVAYVCGSFLDTLLASKCPDDVRRRIWTGIQGELKLRKQAAVKELALLMRDHRGYPINYNHYYTDTINRRRRERQKAALTQSLRDATTSDQVQLANRTFQSVDKVDVAKAVASYSQSIDPNMDKFSCEEAIDCLFAIYKVSSPVTPLP